MIKSILLLLLCCFPLCLAPVGVRATQSTDRCHCFRDRDFDPAHKFSADDYLLTTSFNSLIASTLGVSKQQIVMMKMKGGIAADELLIGLYVAHRTGRPLDLLLSIRDNGGSWQSIVKAALKKESDQDPVLSAIAGGITDEKAAAMITDVLVSMRFQATPEQIARLRDLHFTNKETGLIFALYKITNTPMDKIVAMYRQQKMSWSEIAHGFKLSPAEVGHKIAADST